MTAKAARSETELMLIKADEDRYVLRFGLPRVVGGFGCRRTCPDSGGLDLLRAHVLSRARAIGALGPNADVSYEPLDDATIEER
jgi:hypothetical protein